jgi:integrase
MHKKRRPNFPEIVKKAHATVKIYQIKNRAKTHYCVSFVTATGRKRRNFADLGEARREAATIAHNLAGGDLEALKLTGRERQIYIAAEQALAPTGLSLDVAAREFANAFGVLGHGGIIEAARYYKKHVESSLPDIPVAAAVEKFAAAKKAEGLSPIYLKDIRIILGRFQKHFECNIASVTPEDLRDYLNAMKIGPVARNNHRRLIIVLFNFAKAQGWLRPNEETAAAALGIYKVKQRDVAIYTPTEIGKLLENADREFLPYIALIAFGGIRREELGRGLDWSAIDFERETILTSAAIAKTGRKRKIEMSKNLTAWLRRYKGSKGPIFNRDPRKRMAKLSKAAGITWKPNALRHSFGSYRLEQTKNAGQVALEMGNSAAVVMKHYFEIVDKKAAEQYWSIKPVRHGDRKIISMS